MATLVGSIAIVVLFTPADVESSPGFQPVPVDMGYAKERSYGWDLSRRQAIRNIHNDNGYPNRLDSTGVSRATFLCDLPNGRYRASLFAGGLWRTSIDEMNRLVSVNSREVVRDERPYNELMDKEYFRYANATLITPDDLARPGYAVWDKYLARRYRRYDFSFEVSDGQLRLEIQHGYANGLIVFPERLQDRYRQIIDDLERARRRWKAKPATCCRPIRFASGTASTDRNAARRLVPRTRSIRHTCRAGTCVSFSRT